MKKRRYQVISFFVLSILIVSNCNVEKRRYTKGFYICQKRNATVTALHEHANNFRSIPENKKTAFVCYPGIIQNTSGTSASGYATATKMDVPFVPAKKRLNPPDSCADVITFMDGNELMVRVEEITPEYVAYHRCDYLTGPLIKKVPAEIFRIKYGNGRVRVFEHPPVAANQQQPDDYNTQESILKPNGWAVTSFVTSLFSFLLIPAFAAVIAGIVALVKFDKNPGKYKGKWMAITGLVIGLFALLIFLLFFFA
jgi:hypothetical protein